MSIPPKSTSPETMEAHEHCGSDECTTSTPPAKPKSKKKRYVPPHADSNTFASQQAFLDSWKPIPIEEVDINNRKCPICWKPYGEAADPGFDNSEQPVKLRCDHTFGDKCLASTFCLPDTSKIELQPLSFSLHSRAHALGQKLHAYVMEHEGNSKNHIETFEKMLTESQQPRKGGELFGNYWWPILQELQHIGRNMNNITFLENAVVLDLEPTRLIKQYVPSLGSIQPSSLTQAHNMTDTMDQTLSEATAMAHLSSFLPVHLPSTNTLQWPLSTTPEMVSSNPVWAATDPSQSFSPLNPASEAIAKPTEPAATTTPTSSSTFKQLLAAHNAPMTWEEALTKETALDKLTAIQKKVKESLEDPVATQQSQVLVDLHEAQVLQVQLQRQRQEAQKRQKQNLMALLAYELASAYVSFRKNTQDGDFDKIKTPEKQPHLIRATIIIHTYDSSRTSYEITPPSAANAFIDEDEDDEENEIEIDIQTMVPLITRTFCNACCKFDAEEGKNVPFPESLWWRNDAKTPDDCPLCHKILFRKGRSRSRHPVGMLWDEDISNGE